LKLYVDSNKAYKYTLIFMFFSIFNFYSYNLLRDVAIAFFYICGIYYALEGSQSRKIPKLILMLIFNWIVFELRFEHGLLFSLLTAYVGFKIFYKNKITLLIFSTISILLFSALLFSQIDNLLRSSENYSNFTDESVNAGESSISQYTYNLPPVLKQLAIILISQIQPFPSWFVIGSAVNIYQTFYGVLQLIYTLFWFI